MNILCNPAAEKAVLSACYNGGIDVYYDIADIIKPSTFVESINQLFFTCIKHSYDTLKVQKCDLASFQSAAYELGIDKLINKTENSKHIRQIMDFHIDSNNARKFAQKIRKLEIARLLNQRLNKAAEDILSIDGSESINSILGIAENAVFDFSKVLQDGNDDPVPITDGIVEYLEELRDSPVQQPGISTGFPIWDSSIGGGLRGGTVNMLGARAKGFKSGLALNMARNISSMGLPVLYLDTEMRLKDQQPRLVASASRTKIGDIETGAFGQTDSVTANVMESAKELLKKNKTFYYKNIAGFSFEEQIATMRRWLFKTVGVNLDKKANPCVIVYDYCKLMDDSALKNLAEYQAIGFLLTQLHNFAVMYDIPILSFVQLNRDGIDQESVSAVSQSDRIIWLCSNFTILKPKSDEDIALDGIENGNFKLVPLVCRHGPGVAPKEYIACKAQRECAYIEEVGYSKYIREMNNVVNGENT